MGLSEPQTMPLISVVVPIYKVEKYLRKCLNSIIGQTYINLEIILVDDGSPDNCGAICDEYASKDNRIRVIHKSNGGLSSARNAGIAIAAGEFIGFVDSDDYCDHRMYEKLYGVLLSESADIAICGFTCVDEQGVPMHIDGLGMIETGVVTGGGALRRLSGYGWPVWVMAQNKLFRLKLFDKVKFPEGRFHEDAFTIHHFFGECTRVSTTSEALLYYTQREGSIMSSPFSLKKFTDTYAAYFDRYVYFRSKGAEYNDCARATLKTLLRPLHRKSLAQYFRRLFGIISIRLVPVDSRLRRLCQRIFSAISAMRILFGYLTLFFLTVIRKEPRVFLFATPVNGNLGDQAIVSAEKEYFTDSGKTHNLIEVRSDVWQRYSANVTKLIKRHDKIIISGGGYFDAFRKEAASAAPDIVSRFGEDEIVTIPQTRYCDGSIVMATKGVPNKRPADRAGVLICLRKGFERVVPVRLPSEIKLLLRTKGISFHEASTVINKRVTSLNRKRELLKKWREFAKSRLVITDRPYDMIFAVLTRTPCVAIGNKGGQMGCFYKSAGDSRNVIFVQNTGEILPSIIEMWEKTDERAFGQ